MKIGGNKKKKKKLLVILKIHISFCTTFTQRSSSIGGKQHLKFQGSCFPLVDARKGEEGSWICFGFIHKQSF